MSLEVRSRRKRCGASPNADQFSSDSNQRGRAPARLLRTLWWTAAPTLTGDYIPVSTAKEQKRGRKSATDATAVSQYKVSPWKIRPRRICNSIKKSSPAVKMSLPIINSLRLLWSLSEMHCKCVWLITVQKVSPVKIWPGLYFSGTISSTISDCLSSFKSTPSVNVLPFWLTFESLLAIYLHTLADCKQHQEL